MQTYEQKNRQKFWGMLNGEEDDKKKKLQNPTNPTAIVENPEKKSGDTVTKPAITGPNDMTPVDYEKNWTKYGTKERFNIPFQLEQAEDVRDFAKNYTLSNRFKFMLDVGEMNAELKSPKYRNARWTPEMVSDIGTRVSTKYADVPENIANRIANTEIVTSRKPTDDFKGSRTGFDSNTNKQILWLLMKDDDAPNVPRRARYVRNDASSGTLAHEFGHTGYGDQTATFYTMPQWQRDVIKKDNLRQSRLGNDVVAGVPGWKYTRRWNTKPGQGDAEFGQLRSDLMTLRYYAHRLGIYNAYNDEFTPENLKQFKKKLIELRGKGMQQYLPDRVFRGYSDKMIVWMMNNIAENKNNQYTKDPFNEEEDNSTLA